MTTIAFYIGLLAGGATALVSIGRVVQMLWWLHCRLMVIDEMIDEHQHQKESP